MRRSGLKDVELGKARSRSDLELDDAKIEIQVLTGKQIRHGSKLPLGGPSS